jgi:hypothetical protein
MSRFKDVLAVTFAVVFLAVAGTIAIGMFSGNSPSDAHMDELTFKRTTIAPSDWTGEVVRSEKMEEGLFKVLVKRTETEKQDTLLATTELAVGTKVRHVQVVTINPGNQIPATVRFAFPVPATK